MDLRQKVFDDRGPLKRLAGSIPGYDGYQRKEMRRDADKLLRSHLANQLTEELRRLNELKVQLVSGGQLLAIGPLERATTKLQLFVDRIRTATYGYAGWFDAITIQDTDLDILYGFDSSLGDGVPRVSEAVTRLASAIAAKGDVAAAANELIAIADDLNAQFDRRQDFLVLGKRPPAPALDVLEARVAPSEQGLALASLEIGDAVTCEGVDYLVNGKIAFAGKGQRWSTYQIKDNQAERWLWVGDDGNTVALLEATDLAAVPAASAPVKVGDEEFKLARQGSAEAAVEGPSGRRSGIFVEYWSLTSAADRLLWVEKWGEGVKAYAGKRVSPDELKAWKR